MSNDAGDGKNHHCDVKLSNFTHQLYEVAEHSAEISFSFSKLRYGPFGFSPQKISPS